VPIPLLSGDADVALDLQQTFTATYDLLGYDLAIDYTRSPEPALDDAASVIADDAKRLGEASSVAKETARNSKITKLIDGGNCMTN
jgi:hypothetical protein